MKVCLLGPNLFRVDGQRDRQTDVQDEANSSRLPQFCESA